MDTINLDGISKGDLIAVAMSGGVDSSVTAALLVEAGYTVIGITLQLYDHGQLSNKKGACCAGQDIYDARTVADRFGFPHYVLDYENTFRQAVIDDFVETYLQGETPVPCIRCNQRVKFKDLLKTAQDLGAKALVTGHYVQRLKERGKAQLHRAIDPVRDQSYFLFATTQEQLEYLRFPLGGLKKSETREHARRLGLTIAEKPDSQDICFVPTGGYAQVVEKFRPGALDAGEIVHMDGRILGQHQGIINFTVGQRRGLGISSSDPLYVIEVDAVKKTVVVGPKEALAKKTIYVKDINWLDHPSSFQNSRSLIIKIRSTNDGIQGSVQQIGHSTAVVEFDQPEYGVSKGQACVFYDGSRVAGGGWIAREPQ